MTGACTSGTGSGAASGPREPETIPQPVFLGHFPVAPESERVDLTMPTFSDPTNVTNPLVPRLAP